jgi:radical SAM superfamily enzyme YgiQ (UPF0313 family)
MIFSPLEYDEPLFRPPAEANSLIFQFTIGCSWNKCAFCEMYTMKKFKIRDNEDVKKEIITMSKHFPEVRKFFVADGNAMVLPAHRLIDIFNHINNNFNNIQRISAYALPGDIIKKSGKDLENLRKAGLKLLYIGIETGDNDLLKTVNKNETYESTLEGLKKAHNAGIDTSVMIITGLGGEKYSIKHAEKSAEIVNEAQPRFLSLLTLSLPFGLDHYITRFKDEYIPLDLKGLLNEVKIFVSNTELNNTIFRTDHISNFLVLKGILSRDEEKMLEEINTAIDKYSDLPIDYSRHTML